MKPAAAAVVTVVAASLAFVAGRETSDEELEERREEERAERWLAAHEGAPLLAPRVVQPTRRTRVEVRPTDPSEIAGPPIAGNAACSAVNAFARQCQSQLDAHKDELRAIDDERKASEGTAIPVRATEGASRFGQAALTGALQQAFLQGRVPGGVEGIDCSEHPCILFGRIEGGEDQMEKLEKTAALDPYVDDILTVLMWTSNDEEAQRAARERGEDGRGLEQSLFACALYPKKDRAELGDNLDRRIRSRTAELWNTTAPSDATAAR